MKLRIIAVFLLVSAFLAGCTSERQVDKKIYQYINEKYDFDIEITYRESLNEGNMGDRTFLVKKKNEPKLEFAVYLEGMMKTEVVGDNYEEQEQAYQIGENFFQTYADQLSTLGFSDIVFSDRDGLMVDISYHEFISIFVEQTFDPLLKLVEMLNSTGEEYQLTIIHFKNGQDPLYLRNIDEITTLEDLKTALVENTSLINESLLMRDEEIFLSLDEELKQLGYEYYYGLFGQDSVDKSLICYERNLKNSECTGGYNVVLKGESLEDEQLYRVVETLNASPITFEELIVKKGEDTAYLNKVYTIQTLDQMREMLEVSF